MADTKTFHVEPGTDLDALLDAASSTSVELERNGVRYRVSVAQIDGDIWQGYDPDALRAAIKQTAGSWRDFDGEALKKRLYRAREEGTRSVDDR